MSAGRYDIEIEQGSTFSLDITYQDTNNAVLDLSSGYTSAMQIRESAGSDTSVLSLTSGVEITLGSTGPNIQVVVGPSVTASLDFDHAFYDLELIQAGSTEKIIKGSVKLIREITK